MGRKGSQLLTFLKSGIEKKKYKNLKVDASGLTFNIILPHKTRRLSEEDEKVFKDWYELKSKDYVFGSNDYTKAKQALIASLKKSDYFEKVPNSHNKLTYRILEEHEIKEKKRLKKELKQEVKIEATCIDDPLLSVESGYGSVVDSPPSGNFVETTKDNLLTLGGSELSQVFNDMEASRNVEFNEAVSSVKLGYDCGIDFLTSGNSVEPYNDNFIISSDNGLSQACHVLQANSLFQNNDIQQTTYSTPCALDGFVMSEAIDDGASAENSVIVLDATALFEDLLNNIQPFTDNLRSTNYLHENHEYSIPCLNLMECSTENTELSSSDSIENYPAKNEVLKIWNMLQATDISDEEMNKLIIEGIPALNSNPSMTTDENLNNRASEMQNMHEQHTECKDLLTKELRNKLMGDISNTFSHPSMSFEENIPKQISSSQGKIKTDFAETVSKETTGFKTVKEYCFASDHLAMFSKPNVE
ncbi:hypothetical protein AVEN_213363-1 [Araneus ventricosus]|uniref:Uncharacterized protein n=1 Tax=Araneus ventricosus TaxID=182803 RepID=A0A4Y2G0X2_ARAVE|nr:hypothetical protein AVEN_213363-1 [Araneus ventricosus]